MPFESITISNYYPMTISLEFDYTVDGTSRTVRLFASAEPDDRNFYYRVYDICVKTRQTILPDIFICRHKGVWVHTDSLTESSLSRIIGKALDKLV